MKSKEFKYYNFQEILHFLSFDYKFTQTNKQYPFNKKPEDIMFSWGQILIPKTGIENLVQNKISDVNDQQQIKEIKMMYQIPFIVDGKTGIINQNLSLSFRYDKEYKYGDINKSIYEVAYFIIRNSRKTNDFYIISDDTIQTFMSEFVINNQYGIGATEVCSTHLEHLELRKG